MSDRVTVSQMPNTELYEIFLDGAAEDHGLNIPSLEKLTAENANHYANIIAIATECELSWEGYKPEWI